MLGLIGLNPDTHRDRYVGSGHHRRGNIPQCTFFPVVRRVDFNGGDHHRCDGIGASRCRLGALYGSKPLVTLGHAHCRSRVPREPPQRWHIRPRRGSVLVPGGLRHRVGRRTRMDVDVERVVATSVCRPDSEAWGGLAPRWIESVDHRVRVPRTGSFVRPAGQACTCAFGSALNVIRCA